MGRVHLDVVKDTLNDTPNSSGTVTMLRVLANPQQNAEAYANLNSAEWAQVTKDIARLKW